MKKFEKIIISAERILLGFYSLILIFFVLLKLNVLEAISFLAVISILDLPNIFSYFLPIEASVFLYYLILFMIPLAGFALLRQKHLKLHAFSLAVLVLLVLSHLHLFYRLI